jgi:hypothetical protein
MKNEMESRGSEDSRRGFFRRCLETGTVLAAAPPGHAGASGVLDHGHLLGAPAPGLEEYERIMGRTGLMDVVGRPRSWSVVSRGLHPFSPERIVVLRSGSEHPWRGGGYGVRVHRRRLVSYLLPWRQPGQDDSAGADFSEKSEKMLTRWGIVP